MDVRVWLTTTAGVGLTNERRTKDWGAHCDDCHIFFVEGAELSIRDVYEPRCSQRVATFFSKRRRMPVDSKASGKISWCESSNCVSLG